MREVGVNSRHTILSFSYFFTCRVPNKSSHLVFLAVPEIMLVHANIFPFHTQLHSPMPRIPLNVASSLPRTLGKPPKSIPLDFSPTDADARSLFRTLWRVGSLSVMYTNPGRDVIRQKIREGFEESRRQPATSEVDIRQRWERGMSNLPVRAEELPPRSTV